MPHRTASFRDLDELVKLSPQRPQPKREKGAEAPQGDDVHDLLFESAWRKTREERRENYSSNE